MNEITLKVNGRQHTVNVDPDCLFGFAAGLLVTAACLGSGNGARDSGAADFEAIIAVPHHPRCMNCHSKGDFPRHGDGIDAVKCSACHEQHNVPGLHAPPGALGWELPSPDMPMIWQGLTDRQLCELFKDPKQNGRRTVQQIVEHMSSPLVLWGWEPGEGRTAVSMPHSEFVARVQA